MKALPLLLCLTSCAVAQTLIGWNHLGMHCMDDRHLHTQPYDAALAAKGYTTRGLEASVREQQKPVLCAACHASEALATVSFPEVKPLTQSMHAMHADVIAPDTGMSLYRFSKGHGGLQCSACHGSTHAIYPSAHRNDNVQNIAAQGHAAMPVTVSGGPHGMHPTGSAWIGRHKESGKSSSCQACHGADLRGTPLSRSFSDQALAFSDDGVAHRIPLFRGATVSCFLCHKRQNDGRLGGVLTNNGRPASQNASLVTAINTPGSLTLRSSDPNGHSRTLRIVSQPQQGSVALSNNTATYFPEKNFAGADSFTFAAFDGFADSNLAIVSVTVGDPASIDTLDRDGDQWPDLVEYALGLTIGCHNAPLTQSLAFRNCGAAFYRSMRLSRSPAPGDVTAGVEFSSDLIQWVPGVNVATTPFLLEVRDPAPAANHSNRFTHIHAKR